MEHGKPSRSHTLKENGLFLPRSQLTIAPHLGLGLVSPSALCAVLAGSCAYFYTGKHSTHVCMSAMP